MINGSGIFADGVEQESWFPKNPLTILPEMFPGLYHIHVWVRSLKRHVVIALQAGDMQMAMMVAERRVQDFFCDKIRHCLKCGCKHLYAKEGIFSAAWTKIPYE